MSKNCVICGKPSGMYPLCREHLQMKNDGKVVKCEDCGTWHFVDSPCQCKKTEIVSTSNVDSELACIICGEPSNGKHFCYNCYRKFKDKVLYIQVSKCKEFIKLDAEYQSDFTCDDGHLVKSPYEKMIDDYFYHAGIFHAYEPTLDIDKDNDIHPDFFIPEYNGINDIYIEFFGYGEDNVKYTKQKEYKQSIYPKLCKERGITVLYLTKRDCNNVSATLTKKLKYLEVGQVNQDKE